MDNDKLVVWIQDEVDAIRVWWSINNYDPDTSDGGSFEESEMWYGGSAKHGLLKKLAKECGVEDQITWMSSIPSS